MLLKILFLTLINMLVLLGAAKLYGLRLNITPSYPLGFYKISDTTWNINDLVELCLPDSVGKLARERDYLPKSAQCNGVVPVIKKVVAIEGDEVFVSSAVAVNGKSIADSQLRLADTNGYSLTKAASGVLGANQAWVMSVQVSNSFDSRYFGAVDTALIKHRLEPLWTF